MRFDPSSSHDMFNLTSSPMGANFIHQIWSPPLDKEAVLLLYDIMPVIDELIDLKSSMTTVLVGKLLVALSLRFLLLADFVMYMTKVCCDSGIILSLSNRGL